MRILLVAALVGTIAGCGSGSAGPAGSADPPPAEDPPRYENPERGFSVAVPAGWHRAESRLTALTDPVETLVVATYTPRHGSQGCGPVALSGFDADEVLVTILERGLDPASDWPDFPPRPAHFAFEPGMTSEFGECLRTNHGIRLKDHWFGFTDAGRHFHVLVAVGADAPLETEREAYLILDSLRFDPGVKPDWHSAG